MNNKYQSSAKQELKAEVNWSKRVTRLNEDKIYLASFILVGFIFGFCVASILATLNW